LDATSPFEVIHPKLECPDRQLGLARDDDVLPVGRPGGRSEFALLVFRELARNGAVGVHDPNILRAITVGEESDELPIGRIAWLAVEREAGRQSLRLAAFHRHGVAVAPEVKGHGIVVGREVERDPDPFAHSELYLSYLLV